MRARNRPSSGVQQRPKSPDQLNAAVALYDKALSICQHPERAGPCPGIRRKGKESSSPIHRGVHRNDNLIIMLDNI
jgi:hypothetical protein